MAPGASLFALRVLGADGTGQVDGVVNALQWILDHHTEKNIRIVNLSFGMKPSGSLPDANPLATMLDPIHGDPLAIMTKALVDAGVFVVAAAGNVGQVDCSTLPAATPHHAHAATGSCDVWGGITEPGTFPWVFTAGASSSNGSFIREDDARAKFSSRGPAFPLQIAKPDMLAGGVGIESTAAAGSTLYKQGALADSVVAGARAPFRQPTCRTWSLTGTSQAAAVVSGVAAQMLQANPSLTPNLIKAILEYTSQDYAGYSPLEEGAGFLNALGAVRLSRFYATAQKGPARAGRADLEQALHLGQPRDVRRPDAAEGERVEGRRRCGARRRPPATTATTSSGARRADRTTAATTSSGARRTTATTSSGAPPTATTSSGARAATATTSCGAPPTMATTSSGARTAAAPTATTSCGARRPTATTSSGAPRRRRQHRLGHRRRRQHRVGHRRDGDNIVWGTAATATTSSGAPPLTATTSSGAPPTTATTSCGARPTMATTSSGAPRRRRQHRLGHVGDGDNIVWGTDGDNIVWGTAVVGPLPATQMRVVPAVPEPALRRVVGGARVRRFVHLEERPRQAEAPKAAAATAAHVAPEVRDSAETSTWKTCPTAPAWTSRRPRCRPARWSSATGGTGCRCCAASACCCASCGASDAASLCALLTTEEVSRFISPPPTTVEGFERFISWTLRQRVAGTYVCYAVTLRGFDTAIGIIQVRQLEAGFGTAEWGFMHRLGVLGHRRVPGERGARARLRVRHARRAPARGARGGAERPRQRRAAEDRRGAGMPAAQVVPARMASFLDQALYLDSGRRARAARGAPVRERRSSSLSRIRVHGTPGRASSRTKGRLHRRPFFCPGCT